MQIRTERGIALPVTIFMITLITLLLATGFTRIKAEGEITANSGEVAHALAVAHSGLESYFSTLPLDGCLRPIRPVDGDSVRINVVGGYAWVTAREVQRPPDTLAPWLFVVASTGYVVNAAISASPRAQRTVAQFARWQSGALRTEAGYTAANGINRQGGWDASANLGEFRGNDQGLSGCRLPSVAAIRAPLGETPSTMDNYATNGSTPNVQQGDQPSEVALDTDIDWASVVAGAITPDYTTPQLGDWNYSVQVVQGDATLGVAGEYSSGSGLLIVTGNLRMIGARTDWWGVVLVGGRLIFDADDQRFDGLVVTGLNEGLGIPVSKTTLPAVPYTDIDFNSTAVLRAMRNLSGWVPVTNAWMDNWASY